MNLRKLFFPLGLSLFFFILSTAVSAQDKLLSGRVLDSAGRGISGVSVSVKGQTTKGTTTTETGDWSLSVPSNATTLVFSSVGFAYQEVSIGGNTSLTVTMQSTASSLNEVVVLAYGTRRRGDLTGAVTSVTAKDFQKGVVGSSEQLLVGKVAGLQVTSGGGAAGGGSRIRIRSGASLNASNDPLIVIDGVPIESNRIPGSASLLNTINPNDIESISVLKDASATALYGSRASNGVLIITTKKGSSGKIRFNFNTQGSVSEITRKIEVLNAEEIRSIVNAEALATGINTWKNVLGTANTNWQEQIFQTGLGVDNNLSASGSIAKVLPFRISLGYFAQEGNLKTNTFNRLSSSINLAPRLFKDHLSVNFNLKAIRTENRFANEGAVGAAIYFDPTQPVYDPTSKFGGYFEFTQGGDPSTLAPRNPVALLQLRDNTSAVNRILANIQLDYKFHFLPDLHLLVNLGSDYARGEGNDNTDSTAASNFITAGRFVYYKQKKRNQLADVFLQYAKDLKGINSRFDVLVGHSFQDFWTNVYNFSARSQYKDTLIPPLPNNSRDKPQYRLESYLARMNFTVADKYLLTASVRRDASSKFSEENRVGYFPALALAWKLKEEFFQSSNKMNDLKVRFGWGITGQQDMGDDYYGYLPRYRQSNEFAQYQFGNQFYGFLRPSAYDPDRKWETTTTTNIGLDYAFFGNRVSGSVDIYKKKTKDLLSVVGVAPGSNFDIVLLQNVGNMENKGIEFTLNTTPVRTTTISWDFGFNFTYSESKITKLQNIQDPGFTGIEVGGINGGTGNNIGKFMVGYAPYSFHVYKQIYDKSGKPIEGLYEDLNRDGKIDNSDRYFYKKPAPDVLVGVSTQLNFKKFSFGLAGHGAFGNYLYNNFYSSNGTLSSIQNPLGYIGNSSRNYLDTRFSSNSIAQYFSDYYIENASFFRLDNINLGYNFGRVFNNKAGLSLMASIQNVFIATNYQGLDPESGGDTGVNYTIYPRPRIYSLRASLDF